MLSNPPFSLNYDSSELAHTERFKWGFAPEGGKKADLMFLQHMVSVLKKEFRLADIPGYARVITRAELADNDDNLNIRRHADNAPPPSPGRPRPPPLPVRSGDIS